MEETKKSNSKVVVITVVALVVIALIAIVGLAISKSGNSIVGTYELISMVNDGEEASAEDIQLMKSFGLTVTLQVNDDNTAQMSMFGEKIDFTYDKNNFIMEDQSYTYTKNGDVITLEQDGDNLVFRKVDPSQVTEQPTTGAE